VKQIKVVAILGAVAVLAAAIPANSNNKTTISPKVMAAKTVYFEDRTGAERVAAATIAELKKWGRFQLATERKSADLILVLSADPYKGGHVLLASGETGTIDEKGNIDKDSVPNYHAQAPVREAYLFVIDPNTGEVLWSGSHVWAEF
jgi:hypothetical protein